MQALGLYKINILCYIVDMIARIKYTLFGFDKEEFLPIYREGKLDNLDEFVKYKLGKLGNEVVRRLDNAYYVIANERKRVDIG